MKDKITLGIDASRNRSGGAKAHLIGILSEANPIELGIHEIHLWSFKSLLNSIPDKPWIVKHNPHELEKSLPNQIWWQAKTLSKELLKTGCNILFSTDASTFCRFKPMVVMSQDMLSYEPGIMNNFGITKARLRLLTILFIQNKAFRSADGVIFLTHYAGKTIQNSCGPLSNVAYIPHGVGKIFRNINRANNWPSSKSDPIKCIYVSNASMYKHQWNVVNAIGLLRQKGYEITLQLIGGGEGRAQDLLDKQISESDPTGEFVNQTPFVPQNVLPNILSKSHIFIFASSCENMPVTLLEGMSAGLPIACSNRGPMPEMLRDAGIYFDPEDTDSIASSVKELIDNSPLRNKLAEASLNLSSNYSWKKCAIETFSFIVSTYEGIINAK